MSIMAFVSKATLIKSLKFSAVLFALSVALDFVATFKFTPAPAVIENVNHPRGAEIGKISMLYGNPNPLYERALATHEVHNARFGYPFFILREQMLKGFWSKPAYILRVLMSELEKPEAQRLKWLVWVDGDTVVMNPNIPLEIFLPPDEDWGHINAVMTNDHRGLNNGVFFLRVHEWSVWLMTACMNTLIHDPSLELEFEDQSALQYWFNKEQFANNTIHVPQRWFNAYAGYRGAETDLFADPLQPQYKTRENSVKEGDLLVHHAGHKSLRAQRMLPWIEAAEKHLPSWELDLDQTTYINEISEFWSEYAKDEPKRVEAMQKRVIDIARKKALEKEKAAAKKDRKEEQLEEQHEALMEAPRGAPEPEFVYGKIRKEGRRKLIRR